MKITPELAFRRLPAPVQKQMVADLTPIAVDEAAKKERSVQEILRLMIRGHVAEMLTKLGIFGANVTVNFSQIRWEDCAGGNYTTSINEQQYAGAVEGRFLLTGPVTVNGTTTKLWARFISRPFWQYGSR